MSAAQLQGATAWLHRWRRLLAILCVLAFLIAFTGTHLPRHEVAAVEGPDKVLHLVGYFCLGSSFLLALAARIAARARRVLLCAAILAVYGALDELSQPFVGRNASLADWFANLAGIALAVAAVELVAIPLVRRMEQGALNRARVPGADDAG